MTAPQPPGPRNESSDVPPRSASVTPSRRGGTKGVARPDRETLILDAAVEEFGVSSYSGASLASIANRAGISKPLIIKYFKTKSELFAMCAERAGRNLIRQLEPILDGQTSLNTAQVVVKTLDTIFLALADRPYDWYVLSDRTTPIDSAANNISQRYRDDIVALATRGVGTFASTFGLDEDETSILSEIWTNVVTSMVDWWIKHAECSPQDMSRKSAKILVALYAAILQESTSVEGGAIADDGA